MLGRPAPHPPRGPLLPRQRRRFRCAGAAAMVRAFVLLAPGGPGGHAPCRVLYARTFGTPPGTAPGGPRQRLCLKEQLLVVARYARDIRRRGNPPPADAGLGVGGTPGTVCPPSPEPSGLVTPHLSSSEPHNRDPPFFLMGGLLGFAWPPGPSDPLDSGTPSIPEGSLWQLPFRGTGLSENPGPCPPHSWDPRFLGMLGSAGPLRPSSPNSGCYKCMTYCCLFATIGINAICIVLK